MTARAVSSVVAALALAATILGPAQAATPSFVQLKYATPQTNQANVPVAYTSAQTAGNTNIVAIGWSDATSNITSVTDSAGNSYQLAAPIRRGTNLSQAIYYASNIKAAASNTVTVAFSASVPYADVRITEYAGIASSNPVDGTSSANGSGTTANSGAVTTTSSNALIFGAGMTLGSFTAPGSGFTTRAITSPDGDIVEDRIVSATGSYSATATSTSSAWVMQVVAFRPAGGSDTTPPTVAITSPAANAQVNAIVNVTADASDNVAVAGVQFRVDGVDVGAEDSAPPFALAWDTRTVPNGAHTLTARARDTSGNTTVSAPVPVNVTNSSSFQNEVLATGFNLPTSFTFLPDARMLVVELQGTIKVLPPPYTTPSPTPFLQLTNVGSAGVQQGIYEIALDPNFAANHYFYLFYTLGTPNRDRLSRFTANAALTGTVAGSEFVIYQDPQDANAEHHGGAISFGNDGKIYVTTGEHFQGTPAQDLTSPRGKILRFNMDGTVPTDNPFYDGSGPNVDSIWALGLRNPFRAYYDQPTGRYFIGDVGGNDSSTAFEEINLGARGANYGWPNCENGNCGNPAYTAPIYSYPHNHRDAAVVAGFVYHGTQFPSSYQGSFFFADYTQNWIKRLTFDANGNVSSVQNFEPADGSLDGPYGDIVYLREGPDGALYYIDLGYSDVGGTYGVSKIRRIRYNSGNLAPIAVAAANPTSGTPPLTVNFSSAGSSDPENQPLTYSWTFGDGTTSTAANPSHTYAQPGSYTARLAVSDGVNTTNSTPLTISVGSPPVPTITSPQDGAFFVAGDVISYSGDATDPDQGTLPASAFTWNIDFLHDGHVHPGTPVTGVKSGTFTIPTTGHDFEGNTRYRIMLTVTDADGLTASTSVIIWPRKVNLSFDTVPSGLTLYLDGIAKATPFTYDTLIGFNHTVDARNQTSGNTSYTFASWSDGGAQLHTIVVPASAQSYTATFTGSGATATDLLRPAQVRDAADEPSERPGGVHERADGRQHEHRRDRLERRDLEHHVGHRQRRQLVPAGSSDPPRHQPQSGDLLREQHQSRREQHRHRRLQRLGALRRRAHHRVRRHRQLEPGRRDVLGEREWHYRQ